MRTFVLFLLFVSTVLLFGCDGMKIPTGAFQMGSNDPEAFPNEQVNTVSVEEQFYMDFTEVTNAAYQEFVLANPQWQKGGSEARMGADENYLKLWNGNDYPDGKENHPVVYVSWHAAAAYAAWAEKRLPTEAEWEKAARGGLEDQKYPWGDSIDATNANYDWNVGDTVPVGQYPPNDYGLRDMAGNVWEWCADAYEGDEDSRVLRGGSWLDTARFVRVSARGWSTRMFTSNYIGFRCARRVSVVQDDPDS